MLDVHSKIHEVKKTIKRDYSSTKLQPFDPIPPVADMIAKKYWLLCFDEFQARQLIMKYSFFKLKLSR